MHTYFESVANSTAAPIPSLLEDNDGEVKDYGALLLDLDAPEQPPDSSGYRTKNYPTETTETSSMIEELSELVSRSYSSDRKIRVVPFIHPQAVPQLRGK